MEISFCKMNGAGNDFVVVDNRDSRYALDQTQIARLCDRHRGIGADGLLAVEPAQNGADYRMRYYNADGGEAEMCGNGARCFGRYVNSLHNFSLEKITFETPAGVIGATFHGDHVRIKMSEPHSLRQDLTLDAAGTELTVHSLNTGVPHAVVFVGDIAEVPVKEWGAALRYHEAFAPKGTNANFVHRIGTSHIAIRTYERGVEDETLACGTGTVACAILHHLRTGHPAPIAVDVHSGDTLEINFTPDGTTFKDVTLTGPADIVFHGTVQL
jgi:diaminopimelate epimerase